MFEDTRKWICPALVMLTTLSGCIGVQVKFKPVVPLVAGEPGGWQEACLEALIQNMTTQDSHVCLVGIGMPMHTRQDGVIPSWAAGEIAAECINDAADEAVRPAPPTVPSAVACTSFKDELARILGKRVMGSRVALGCTAGIPHTQVGF